MMPHFFTMMLTLAGMPEKPAANDSFDIGELKAVNLAGIPYLRDDKDFYVYPAFCPTACNTFWEKSGILSPVADPEAYVRPNPKEKVEGTHHLGGLRVEFAKPGMYTFDYFIQPLVGEFHYLKELQVVVLPDEAGILKLDDIVNWSHYVYTPLGKSMFRIEKPGKYVIAFGPAKGMALTKLEVEGAPVGFMLKHRVTPTEGVTVLKADMDVVIRGGEEGKKVQTQYFGYDALTDYGEVSKLSLDQVASLIQYKIPKDIAEKLMLRAVENGVVAGASLRYPLGRNALIAANRLKEIIPFLEKIEKEGHKGAIENVTAKIVLALNTIAKEAGGEEGAKLTETVKKLITLRTEKKYAEFITVATAAVAAPLKKAFPTWQKDETYSAYWLDAVDEDTGKPIANFSTMVKFGKTGSNRLVKTNEEGKTFFVGPSGTIDVLEQTVNSAGTSTTLIMSRSNKNKRWKINSLVTDEKVVPLDNK